METNMECCQYSSLNNFPKLENRARQTDAGVIDDLYSPDPFPHTRIGECYIWFPTQPVSSQIKYTLIADL